jgi:hypothetical protein
VLYRSRSAITLEEAAELWVRVGEMRSDKGDENAAEQAYINAEILQPGAVLAYGQYLQ